MEESHFFISLDMSEGRRKACLSNPSQQRRKENSIIWGEEEGKRRAVGVTVSMG